MDEKLEQLLNGVVRPQLWLHGGGIQSISFVDGVYRFRLIGQCAGCPSAYLTTEELIRGALMDAIPEIRDVVLDQQVSDDLLAQAKAILNHEIPQ